MECIQRQLEVAVGLWCSVGMRSNKRHESLVQHASCKNLQWHEHRIAASLREEEAVSDESRWRRAEHAYLTRVGLVALGTAQASTSGEEKADVDDARKGAAELTSTQAHEVEHVDWLDALGRALGAVAIGEPVPPVVKAF